jgi:hypothetical protein
MMKCKLVWLMMIAVSVLMGCVARMDVRPTLLSAAEEMRVKGRWSIGFTKPFSFGRYEVTDIKKEWTRTSGFSVNLHNMPEVSKSRKTRNYEFMLKDGNGKKWKCKSTLDIDAAHLNLSESKKMSVKMSVTSKSFACSFKVQGEDPGWNLTMSERFDDSCLLKGVLSDGNTSFIVQGTHKLADGVWDMADYSGFEIFLDGKIVGSVEIINSGAVWIHPELEEHHKPPVAVMAAAMLLYIEIGGR